MADAEFMISWEDPTTVAKRLSSALHVQGIVSPIISSKVDPLSNHSGLSGDLSSLTLTFEDSTSMKLILKRTKPFEDSKKSSKKLGLYREGVFYSTIGPWIQNRLNQVPNYGQEHTFIPQALFSASDADTGQKAIVLQCYDALEAGAKFPHSVHNVVRKMRADAEDSTKDGGADDTLHIRKSITLEAARIAALLHGSFYYDSSLFTGTSFADNLRMADWIQGKNKESFLESQQEIVDRWANAKARWKRREFFSGKVQLGTEFVEIMDASCALALNFDLFVSKWNDQQLGDDKIAWSLVHGDYHPGNFLYFNENRSEDERPKMILIDWEVVGIGSGPQDIGQFLISHLETGEAHAMLEEVASVYRQTLQTTLDAVNSNRSKAPTLRAIKNEIIYGGIERWVWLFAFMCGHEAHMPYVYMQFFHDQMQKFIIANSIAATNIGMPRP